MLDKDNSAFIQKAANIILAACTPSCLPSVSRGFACKLIDGGQQIGIAVLRSQSIELLESIRLTGRVANSFSQPSNNRSLQLKGIDAHIVPFDPADEVLIERHISNFHLEALSAGTTEEVMHVLFNYALNDMVMVIYKPTADFDLPAGQLLGAS